VAFLAVEAAFLADVAAFFAAAVLEAAGGGGLAAALFRVVPGAVLDVCATAPTTINKAKIRLARCNAGP